MNGLVDLTARRGGCRDGNAEETDLEEDVDEKRGVHEDVENSFVDPDYPFFVTYL